jgi:thiamine-phosphate pyrophosphorylase
LVSFGSKVLSDIKLYLITDRKLFAGIDQLLAAVEAALRGGVSAVQLREKDLHTRAVLDLSYSVRELTKRYEALLFINDRVDLAMAVEADGVHLGQAGMPAHAARKVSAGKIMIGVSAHSIDQARKAADDGADFVTIGPVYDTPSKRQYGSPIGIDVIREAAAVVAVPLLAIGGITVDRVAEVMGQGASGVALISAVLTSGDIKKTTEEFMRKLL